MQTQSESRVVYKSKNLNANKWVGSRGRVAMALAGAPPGRLVLYVSLSWVPGVDGLWEDLSWDA